MDGREGIMPGASSYFINRGLGSPNSGLPPVLHGPPGMRHMSNPNPNLPAGGSFQLESLGSSMPMSMPMSMPVNVGISGSAGAGQGEPTKRKRGRPRKYGPDGSVALALSPLSSAAPISGSGLGSLGVSVSGSGSSTPRRGRGRPPGTGRKQQLASLGEWVAGSAGMGFTPHIITIPVGEDIASKIMSFSQQGPRAVCILSASGAVSTVTLRHPANSGGTVTYEGRFEILCLSGSYLLTEDAGSRNRSGGLSISLANPDGRVIGGGVGGLLIAATPVQVIVGSFLYGGSKAKNKGKTDQDSGPENEIQMGDTHSTPTGALPSETLSPPLMGGWPGSRHLDMRNANIDIDLTRG